MHVCKTRISLTLLFSQTFPHTKHITISYEYAMKHIWCQPLTFRTITKSLTVIFTN